MVMRLDKLLAHYGIGTRKEVKNYIRKGFVTVNGSIIKKDDFKVDYETDKIIFDGELITYKPYVYIMLNKPRGFITTMSDEMDRKCVAELVSDIDARIYPVGRLDRESEGLLLMTNDGEFANALTHPSMHVPKTYRVTIHPSLSKEQRAALENGVEIDGKMTLPSEVRVVSREEGRVVIELTIFEGRNRQIRKMCESLGLEVARLKRIKIGSVKLGMLKTGDYRHLTPDEVHALMTSAEQSGNLRRGLNDKI